MRFRSSTTYYADHAQTKFGSASSMTYDADGNLTSDGANTYTWDARHHLSAISGPTTSSFVYDAFGRRAAKTVNGATTQFPGACPPRKRRDGLNPVEELDGAAPPNVTANLLTGLGLDEYFTCTDAGVTSEAARCLLTIGEISF